MSLPSNAEILGEDVARIYDAKNKLAAASANPIAMSGELPTYQIVLNSVKGSEQVKQLAADYVSPVEFKQSSGSPSGAVAFGCGMIPQFLHYFPTLVESGINAQLDLCEDDKVMIRIHAIRGLELICKNNPSTVRRIAEMLGQLLVSEEKLELAAVKATFTSLFAIDPQAAFLALFTLVSTGVDANLRTKGLEFLIAQLKAMQGALRKDESVAAGLCAGLKAMLGGAQNAVIGREDLKFLVQTLISLCPHGNNAAKIKADETLKAELANVALVQSGLGGGALDLNNEAALRHFLAVQSVVANLANNYDIDTAPFQQFYFAHLLPNLELIQSTELRTQLLRAVANGASKIQPKQAQTFFPSFYAQFKKFVPTGEIVAKAAPAAAAAATAPAAPAADTDAMTDAAASESSAAGASTNAPSSSVNFAFAEVFLFVFHILASQAPSQLRAATGIFTPTGQPGDFDAAPGALRDEFNNRVQFLLQQNAAYKEQLHTVQRKIQDEIKAFNKKNQMARAAAKPAAAAAAAVSPAAAGQPVVEKKEAEAAAPPAAAAAPAGVADESALIQTLRSKLQSVNFAIRIAGSIAMLARPLLDKPMPTLLAADKMGLSWREFKANDKAAQGKQQQQPQQKAAKGQQQQQQQQQSQQKGQKRKSGGGEAQSNKKQSQGAASNKKQSGGQQQQQQQGQANKKQRQSASNKGGNQNSGGRRRR